MMECSSLFEFNLDTLEQQHVSGLKISTEDDCDKDDDGVDVTDIPDAFDHLDTQIAHVNIFPNDTIKTVS